jgi:hypothetical protein
MEIFQQGPAQDIALRMAQKASQVLTQLEVVQSQWLDSANHLARCKRRKDGYRQDHRSAPGSLNGPERLPMRGCRGRLPARLRIALSVHLKALGTSGAITGMLGLQFDRPSASDAGQSCRHAMNSLGAEDGLREAAQSNRQRKDRGSYDNPHSAGRLKFRRRDACAGIAAD